MEIRKDYTFIYKNIFIEHSRQTSLCVSASQVAEENEAKPVLGTTSKDEKHTHAFTVDRYGNGVAHRACHPVQTEVCHEHDIINGIVQPAESELAPMNHEQFVPVQPSHLMRHTL